jgi:hypothetical protein
MRASHKITANATAKNTTMVNRGFMLSRIDPPLDGVGGTDEDIDAVAVALGVAVGAIATTWANC